MEVDLEQLQNVALYLFAFVVRPLEAVKRLQVGDQRTQNDALELFEIDLHNGSSP